jgi:hypothetical protein
MRQPIGAFHAQKVLESWTGKTPNEIATELKCHPKTVRIHLVRFNSERISGLGMRSGRGAQAPLDRTGAQPHSGPGEATASWAVGEASG